MDLNWSLEEHPIRRGAVSSAVNVDEKPRRFNLLLFNIQDTQTLFYIWLRPKQLEYNY